MTINTKKLRKLEVKKIKSKKTEVGDQRSGAIKPRSQMSEVRSQRLEVRDQKSDDRNNINRS